MKLTKKIEAEIKKVMNDYWDSYFDGDLETWASYLPDHYQNIGTTEEEIWKSKQDIVDYTNRVFDQMVGMADMRNKEVQIIPFDPHVMVHELGDVYIKTNDGWSFYAKLRLSSLLENNGNGWKILHQHGSYPDSKVEEGETFAFDKISKENQELREAVKRRTLELENKNRELEIETALERIRAQSMLMQRSKELDATSKIFHEQLVSLGIDSEFSYVWLPDVENKTHKFWAAWTEKKKDSELIKSESFIYDLDKNEPYTAACFEAWESDQVVHVVPVAPEEVEHFFSVWSELLSGAESLKASNFPDGLYYAEAYMKYGCFGINIERRITEDEQEILRRFTVEFERTYTRFLNLQKAEEQAREADIELALEKVRSRSLAMHHTSEIQEIIHTLHEELLKLNISIAGGSFVVINKDIDSQLRAWGAGGTADTVSEVTIPHFGKAFSGDIIKGIRQGPGFFTEEFTHQQKISYFTELFKHEPWSELPDKQKKDVLESEDGYTRSCCVSSHTSIFIINQNGRIFSEEENNILKRFAKVFEQSYTRFLDLQKAEEQAREAEIELALERVRAKTMAMQHSDELMETSELMFEQIKGLDIELWSCGFSLWYDDDSYFVGYNPGPDGKMGEPLKIPLTEDIFFKTIRKSKRRGDEFLVFESEGESLEQTYRYMDTLPVVGETMRGFVEAGYPLPKYQVTHCGFFSNGHLMFITQEQNPEAVEIFKRFTKVFNQTYTRFLDLQKAEEQAREAQIETALERVRSRSMAMYKSEELTAVGELLYRELSKLGLQNLATGYVLFDETETMGWSYGVNPLNGSIRHDPVGMKHIETRVMKTILRSWKKQDPFLVIKLNPEETIRHQTFMAEETINFPISKEQLLAISPERLVIHTFNFKQGYLLIVGGELLGVEQQEMISRFAKVFQQTYTRFLDLQKAEAQAREAQIEAALERVRSRSMAMHNTEELQDVVRVVAEGLKNTGVILDTGGAVICTYFQDSKDVIHWTASEDETHPSLPYYLPYFEDELFDEAWASKNRGDDYYAKEFSFEVKNNFWNYAFEHSDYRQLPDEYKEIILESETHGLAWAWSKNSAIMVPSIQGDLPSEEEKKILVRFANVFEQAYTRLLDLKKAEAQAREAQIELSLERIRAQVTSMQESSDLFDIVVSMRKEFLTLGHEADSFWHMRWLPDVYEMSMTSEDGQRLGMVIKVPKFVHDQIPGLPEWEKGNDPIYVLALDADDAWDYIENMNTHGHYEQIDSNAPTKEDIEHIGGLTFILARTSHGEIGFSLPGVVPDPPEEALETLTRFASVFDLAYTRFEDLKESERRHREVEIDLALEKVRSRSIDMRKTSELEDVILMVNEQFRNLNVHISGGAFIVINEKLKEGFYCWGAGGAGDYVQEVFIPLLDRPISTNIAENIKKGTKFFTEHYSNAEKKEFFQHLFKYPPFSETPSERKKELLELPDGYVRSCAVSEQTSIFIINHHGRVFTEDENHILRQMSRVFEQAYTRFLDLKKASDQAQQISEERDRLEIALNELHATQAQLIQQEKLASLGQLTAGIAHEIKNPLNFVNNFSDLSVELVEETKEELTAISDQLSAEDQEKVDQALEILNDIDMNLRKIYEHGSRADSIVKSMLEHSRGGTGKLEPTDLNALVKEFVNLSFHGMRAGKNPINVDMEFELDENIGEIPLIAEDFSRVIINLCNNGFDAMREKGNGKDLQGLEDLGGLESYRPKLTVRTSSRNEKVAIEIEDNGPGIPEEMKDKIMQPFFTTKKGTEGTGLGLSITNDIVKAHGGELNVSSKGNEGTKFSIQLKKD